MIKKLLFFLFVVISPILVAQDIDRVVIQGKIKVPNGEDAEGISVYNVSSEKGTVTAEDGSFEIAVAKNDRLQIFALQYKSFTVIIDKGVIDNKMLNVVVNPAITQLDEVIVRPYDLSGNVKADVEKIPTYSVGQEWDLTYESLEFGYDFRPDKYSSIEGNVAEEALNINRMEHGLNFISIAGGLGNLLFPKDKMSVKEKVLTQKTVSNNMQQRFSREFIHDNFGIPRKKAFDFLYYVQENGLDKDLLKSENEMKLMEFLHKKSKEYKKLGD